MKCSPVRGLHQYWGHGLTVQTAVSCPSSKDVDGACIREWYPYTDTVSNNIYGNKYYAKRNGKFIKGTAFLKHYHKVRRMK